MQQKFRQSDFFTSFCFKSPSTMNRLVSRGALIVFEGCDKCGKSTQSVKLMEALNRDGIPAKLMRFPDRTTTIGGMCGSYLQKSTELEDHAIHLLFAANRWELVPTIIEAMKQGITVVLDRYAYSGVAYTASKPGLSLEWCKQPDVGLPAPDRVLYLTATHENVSNRKDYGGERYEQQETQERVKQVYEQLRSERWQEIDGNGSIDEIHATIRSYANKIIEESKQKPIDRLWTSEGEPY